MPSNLVRPVIVATAATSNVLEGVKNQVAPDARQEEEESLNSADDVSGTDATEIFETGNECILFPGRLENL